MRQRALNNAVWVWGEEAAWGPVEEEDKNLNLVDEEHELVLLKSEKNVRRKYEILETKMAI